MARRPWPRKLTREHIDWLAHTHDISVEWVRSVWEAEACLLTKTVTIVKPSGPVNYLVALHEFGHLLDKRSRKLYKMADRCFGDALACEAYAWAWAVQHAIPEARPFFGRREWEFLGKAYFSHVLWPDPGEWPELAY